MKRFIGYALCPYLPKHLFVQELFTAPRISPRKWEHLLSQGWRHFGQQFFRPLIRSPLSDSFLPETLSLRSCFTCRACVPLRIPIRRLIPTRSQRRMLKRNRSTEVRFTSSLTEHEWRLAYELYSAHKTRFHRPAESLSLEHFFESFREHPCQPLYAQYWVEGELAGLSFLDLTPTAMSSIYMIFHPRHEKLGLGSFSVFAECAHGLRLGVNYYYLGYWIQQNRHMTYKARFFDHEILDWNSGRWLLRRHPRRTRKESLDSP